MTNKKASLLIIIISLFFAAAMIISSLLLNDTQYSDHSQTITYFLIALWFIPFSYLLKIANKNRKKCTS